MKCLCRPPRPCGLVTLPVFSSAALGASSSEDRQTPRGAPATSHPGQRRGREPRARAAAAPGGPAAAPAGPDLAVAPLPAWHPGGETGRRAPPFLAGVGGPRRQRRAGSSNPPPGSWQTGRAWARRGPGARPMGRLRGGSRGAGARPAHRGRSGPRPGAFRAPAAACLGKSRPPSRRRGPAGQSGGGDSRNLPGDRRRVTGQRPPKYGQRFRCVSGESPGARGGAGPRLRTAHLAPGPLPPGAGRLVTALDIPSPGIRGREEGWTSGLELQDAWTELARGTRIQERATNSSGVGAAQDSPPSARPAWKKRQQKLIKNHFFFLLK